jgi:hypothetical protein
MFAPLSESSFESSVTPSRESADAASPAGRHSTGACSTLIEAPTDRRSALETFVAQRFFEVYGARIHAFLPRLFGAQDRRGALSAVFGLRGADQGPLFLEQYLDAPIEALVATSFGHQAERRHIAEVGNLAGASPGALRSLIPTLTQRLHDEGYRFVAFTGSARLCNGFSRLGLPLRVVAPAPPERLPESERALWGRYYDHQPSVMLGDVALGVELLRALADRPAELRAQLAPLARVGAP